MLAACGGEQTTRPRALADKVTLIVAPPGGEYDVPVWVPQVSRLLVVYSPPRHTDDAAYDVLVALRIDGRDRRKVGLPRRRGCKFTSTDVPVLLPDGRVGYSERCWPGAPRTAVRLRSLDARTGRTTVLRSYALPFSWSFFSVSRDGRIVVNDGRGLEESLWRLGPRQATRMPLPFDIVGYPRWSPDGSRLALDAVPKGTAGSGLDRLDAARNLYLLGRDGTIERALMHDLRQVGPAAWSADGTCLALAMKPRGKPIGLYLVDLHGHAALVLARDHLGGVTWVSSHVLVVAVGVFSHVEKSGGDVGLYRIRLRRGCGG